MTDLRIGCATQPVHRALRIEDYHLLEVHETRRGPVRAKTLRRWRAAMPRGAEAVVTLWDVLTVDPLDTRRPPQAVAAKPREQWGLLRPTETNETHWKEFVESIEPLAPSFLRVPTPVGFSPTTRHQDELRRFVRDWAGPAGLRVIWEPSGLWEHEVAAELAAELDILLATNPFLEGEFPEPFAARGYYTLSGPAPGRRRFTDDDMLDFLDFVGEHEGTVRAVFRGAERTFAARRLHALATGEENE